MNLARVVLGNLNNIKLHKISYKLVLLVATTYINSYTNYLNTVLMKQFHDRYKNIHKFGGTLSVIVFKKHNNK